MQLNKGVFLSPEFLSFNWGLFGELLQLKGEKLWIYILFYLCFVNFEEYPFGSWRSKSQFLVFCEKDWIFILFLGFWVLVDLS